MGKIETLNDWTISLTAADPERALIKGVCLHTPSPADLEHATTFPGLFGIFGQPNGKASAEAHWTQMREIAEHCNLSLASDVDYLISESNRFGLDLARLALEVEDEVKFMQSQYIYDAYTKWGANPKAVLDLFYVGSVIGYGNYEAAFSLDNLDPLKLYVNCEEGWSPETFAGSKIGIDFRHLFGSLGFHMALLISTIKTPWARKESE